MSTLREKLFALASEHEGLFTSAEACAAGIAHSSIVIAARRGILARVSRGIYRFVQYPLDEELAQQWEAVLWSSVDRSGLADLGVLSHLTALRLHVPALEYTPPKISITVDPSIRIRRLPPVWLEVHKAKLAHGETTELVGLPVTSLERTVKDCIANRIDRRLIEHVLSDATRDERPSPALEKILDRLKKALI